MMLKYLLENIKLNAKNNKLNINTIINHFKELKNLVIKN